MSAKLLGQVWDLNLPRLERDVLLAMADHADHEGYNVYPSVSLLAWKTNYSERQVQRAIASLKGKEILVVLQEAPGRTTEYGIDLSKAPLKMPYKEWRKARSATRQNVTPDKMSLVTKSHLNATKCHPRGDIAMSPPIKTVSQPSLETPGTNGANAPAAPSSLFEPTMGSPKKPATAPRRKSAAAEPYVWGSIVPLEDPLHLELRKLGKVAPDASEQKKREWELLARDYRANGRTPEQVRQFMSGWYSQKPTVSAYHGRRPQADEVRDHFDSVLENLGGSSAKPSGLASAARARRRAESGGLPNVS